MPLSYKKLLLGLTWGILSLVYAFSNLLYRILSCKVVCDPAPQSFPEIVILYTIGLPGLASTSAIIYLKDYLPLFDIPVTQGNLWPILIGVFISTAVSYLIIWILDKALIYFRKKKK